VNITKLQPQNEPDDGPDAKVLRLPGIADTPDPASHFEVTLDDAPEQQVPVTPEAAPAIRTAGEVRRPIIAAEWSGWRNIRSTVAYHAGLTTYRTGYHTVRAPGYACKAAFWAVVGVFRLLGRQRRWWWVTEQAELRKQTADSGDADEWLKLHNDVKATRARRGLVLFGELIAMAVGVPLAWWLAPHWAVAVAAVATVAGLAHAGRPADRPIIGAALTTPRFRRLSADIVLRAFYAAGLGHPSKPDQQITFGGPMARDGDGSRVVLDLPHGRTFPEAVARHGRIASGLDVSEHQVFLARDKSSHRRCILWVADRDPLEIPAGPTPLLDCEMRDIWQPAPFGLDERGGLVSILLMWMSVLVGAQPRKGKTFSARLLALFAALDPWVRIDVVDGKNSPDWRSFALVAHTMIYGTVPTQDADPVDQLLTLLREIEAHVTKVNDVLSTLPVDMCPKGKLTWALARDPRYPDLRVWMLVMEEFQRYYELANEDAALEIAKLLSTIIAVGPSAGVVLLSASQKPSGIGAGSEIPKLFTRFRDNHTARFALRCGNRTVSEAVLGGDAYGEGYDASSLPLGDEYLGVGYLYGLTDRCPTVRTYLATHPDAEKILKAARGYREQAGTLSGAAAGQTVTRDVRDVLADVRSIFREGEAGMSWERIASRLAEANTEHYADITAVAVSSQLRDLNVPSVNIKEDGRVLKGARRTDVAAAGQRRKTPE
jgi:hypothetical protein